MNSDPNFLVRWLDRTPLSRLTRTRTFITIPAFNIVNPVGLSYSELVGAFPFEAPNNFALRSYTPPSQPNYIACVSYTTQDQHGNINTVRYKLWEDFGEVMYFHAPLYNGELIRKNFRYEIWSIPGEANSVDAQARTFFTSVLTNKDYRSGVDEVLRIPDALVTVFISTDAPTAPGATDELCWWSWDSGITNGTGSNVASWKDKLSNILLAQATDGDRPHQGAFYIQFLGTTNLVADSALSDVLEVFYLVVLGNVGGNNTNEILDFQSGTDMVIEGAGDGTVDITLGGTAINNVAFSSTITVFEINMTNKSVKVYGSNIGGPVFSDTEGGGVVITPTLLMGDPAGTAAKGTDILALLGYSQPQSADERLQTLQYLLGHHAPYQGSVIPLAMTFPTNSVPVYNQITA